MSRNESQESKYARCAKKDKNQRLKSETFLRNSFFHNIVGLEIYSVCPAMNSLRMEVGGMAAISAGERATM